MKKKKKCFIYIHLFDSWHIHCIDCLNAPQDAASCMFRSLLEDSLELQLEPIAVPPQRASIELNFCCKIKNNLTYVPCTLFPSVYSLDIHSLSLNSKR